MTSCWGDKTFKNKMVLQRAADFGITLTAEKCQFWIGEIDFYEHRFMKNRSKPSSEKTEAVKRSSSPGSKDAAKSFLGMTEYFPEFIPRYASLTAFS